MSKKPALLLCCLSILFFVQGLAQNLPSFEKAEMPGDFGMTDLSHISSIRYRYFDLKNDTLSVRKMQKSNEYLYQDGKLIIINERNPVSDSIVRIYEIDSGGRIQRELLLLNGTILHNTTYEYHEKMRSSVKNILNSDSTVFQKSVVTYNRKMKPVKTEVFDGNGQLSYSYTYRYNKFSDLVEQKFINTPNGTGNFLSASFTGGKPRFDPWQNDSTTFDYQYGKHRKQVLLVQYENSKLVKRTEFTVNKDTLIATTYEFWPGRKFSTHRKITKTIGDLQIVRDEFLKESQEVDSWFENTYKNGDLSSTETDAKCLNCVKSVYSNTFEYDKLGNWIRKKRFSNGQLISVTEREIIYIN